MNKEKRQKRIQQKENHIKRQLELVKTYKFPLIEQPHRLAKKSWCSCGNKNCVYCAKPRKIFGSLTLKEESFKDIEKSYYDEQTESN